MPTPVLLLFGQSNAAFIDNYSGFQAAIRAEGATDAEEIGVHAGGSSVARFDGRWNVTTGDGEDMPGAKYTDLVGVLDGYAADPNKEIVGAIWVQGEADTGTNIAAGEYFAALSELFTQVRAHNGPSFPIFIHSLTPTVQSAIDTTRANRIRSEQQQVADAMSEVYYFDTEIVFANSGLTAAEGHRGDNLHYSDAFMGEVVDAFLEVAEFRTAFGLSPLVVSTDPVAPLPGSILISKASGAGSITLPGGQTLSTSNYGSAASAPATGQSLPRLTGVALMGETLVLDDSMLTNVTSRTLYRNDAVDGTFNGSTITLGAMETVYCSVVADEGTFETPRISARHMHAAADHTAMDTAVLNLVDHGPATHIKIDDQPWSVASGWDVGEVPGSGASALIPEGRAPIYDAVISPRLATVRVDGELHWATDLSTNMLVETVVVPPKGKITIGTADNRVQAGVAHNITISNRSYRIDPDNPTNLDLATDPTLIGRGLLVLGEITTFGPQRDSWVGTALFSLPVIGDISVTLKTAPTGWRVGDTIVIPGTNVNIGPTGTNTRYDETRVITDISGNVVSWSSSEPLIYNHFASVSTQNRPDYLSLPIIVKDRNINFRSEPGAAIHQRGHAMVMHGPSRADIWDVSFFEMGRTDKSKPAGLIVDGQFKFVPTSLRTPTGTDADFEYVPVTADANIQSRYPIHLHFVGFKKPVTDLVRNCYVEDAKAWGMVWHGCEADWINNVVYRFLGTGLVGETGDELGATRDNVVFGLETTVGKRGEPKNENYPAGALGDLFSQGYGYAWRGRAVISTGNYAIGCTHGHVFYARAFTNNFADVINLKRENVDVHDLNWLRHGRTLGRIDHVDYPISHFDRNFAIGCHGGLVVVKSIAMQGHDLNVIMTNFKAWGCGRGVILDYIGVYLLKNFDLMATDFVDDVGPPVERYYAGITMTKTNQIAFVDITTRNYRSGLELDGDQPSSSTNIGYNNTTNPKIIIQRHTSLGDEMAVRVGPFADAESEPLQYTLFLPDDHPEVHRPSVDGPLILGKWFKNFNDPMDIDDPVTGLPLVLNKTDSVSNVRPIPKGGFTPEGEFQGWDTAGMFHGYPNGGTYQQSSLRLRIFDILRREGYHTYQGKTVILYPLYFSDSLTGMSIKDTRLVEIVGLPNGVGPNNGEFVQSATIPVAQNDTIIRTMTEGGTDTFNVLNLANITAEAGATVTLGDPWMTAFFGPEPAHFKPNYGHLTVAENGDVTFEATPGYVGPDRWLAYAYDGRGRWITIEILFDIQPA